MGYCKQFDELFEADSDHAAVAAAAAGRYTFMCRQDDYAPLIPVPDWYDLFHVNVLAYYKNLENDVLVLRSDDSFYMPREFFLERRDLLEIVFVSTLYYVDLPQAVVESIFDEVIRLARSMVDDDGNNVVHRQVLPMTVEIVISENEEEMSARTLRDSRVDEAFPFPLLPEMHYEAVGEWAISQVRGGLEKVALESCSVKPRCVICLDTILVGNRMPCSHIYHGHCIYRWLRKSSSCPLCRFAMPWKLLR
ncbi:putative RING-H2 finger protein ATL35 [Rhododendron vialii]|uniref:putative RING-H2 finger protein ATL35 n=1 Tax=Rhododendron vialii TaxID=182163 RepID=UPI00265E5792|nr:putative RING-H2 finger protein ATL35 [Rhododendron vialii]